MSDTSDTRIRTRGSHFPLDGNGGYDVKHYLLDITYNPDTDVLRGTAGIRARATQNLSRFNLDFVGLTVDSIKVDGSLATWTRDGGELTVTPAEGLPRGEPFLVVVRYHGIPEPIEDELGISGFIATDDGAVIAGEPHVAATWFPANDHPLDKAAYTFKITVPAGVEAVANGKLVRKWTKMAGATGCGMPKSRWRRTWPLRRWASSISPRTVTTGFASGTRLTPRSSVCPSREPASSMRSRRRAIRPISVWRGGSPFRPAEHRSRSGSRGTPSRTGISYSSRRGPWGEPTGRRFADLNGHTSQDTGFSCPFWHELHPFLTHYQTDNGDGTCSPEGTSGKWWAASGSSHGWEQWTVDLSRFAGKTARVSISYASDDFIQLAGAFVDDIVVSTGKGTTSFEDDGATFDGWQVPGAPGSSAPNPNDWIVGTQADAPPPIGEDIAASLAREGEILDFLSSVFGEYPFSTSGGIVDDVEIGFALENQTRPVYSPVFWTVPGLGDIVVAHELTHQWYGDSLALAAWKHIWLNEGFATYAEWLWTEHEGQATVQESFDDLYNGIPEDDPFWSS